MIVSIHAPNRDDSSLSRATSPSQQSRYAAARITAVPAITRAVLADAVSQQPSATIAATRYEIWLGVIGVHTRSRVSGDEIGRYRVRVIALSWGLIRIRYSRRCAARRWSGVAIGWRAISPC